MRNSAMTIAKAARTGVDEIATNVVS